MADCFFRSTNKENIEYSIEVGLWQPNRIPKGLEAGDRVIIQESGTKQGTIMGVVTDPGCIDHTAEWPDGWPYDETQAFSKTVKFEHTNETGDTVEIAPEILSGQWTCRRVG